VDSPYADNALYYAILARIALGQCPAAQVDFTALKQSQPGSQYVPKAQSKLAGAGC